MLSFNSISKKMDPAIALVDLEAEMASHAILRHPFLQAMREGRMSRTQFGMWVTQQFWFSNQFPRCLAALYAQIDDYRISRPLMSFLAVEHWGSEESGAHWRQFESVLQFFDFSLDGMRLTSPFPETQEYLDFRLRLCLERTAAEALGVIAFGHEFVNCGIFESYLRGMEQVPGVTTGALKYFESHVAEEPEDYAILKNIIAAHCRKPGSIELVARGAREVLDARMRFFDLILARITAGGEM